VKGTSFLDFQFARDHHRLFIPLMPLAAKRMNLGSEYDFIISDSAGFGKGITYDRTKTKHLCYVHTPLRYAWETETYFGHNIKAQFFSTLLKPAFVYVRNFDYWAGQQPNVLLANSQYIAGKVKNCYDRDAEVVYPPVDTAKFFYEPVSVVPTPYFLAAGRLLHYKRFDLIIDACQRLNVPLKIVGTGPEFNALKNRAHLSNIEFLGFVKSDEKLRQLYNGAKAFIMANEEDFGLVMAEAMACGTPVIAYGAGGALEIVEQGKTGVLFNEQTPLALIEAVRRFESIDFDRQEISEWAQKFSTEQFQVGMEMAVREITG
jgi:glycosyltransferase involved in cell wall biosynthesis